MILNLSPSLQALANPFRLCSGRKKNPHISCFSAKSTVMLFLFALAGPNDINMAKHRKTVYYKPLILDKNEWLLCPTYIWKDFQKQKFSLLRGTKSRVCQMRWSVSCYYIIYNSITFSELITWTKVGKGISDSINHHHMIMVSFLILIIINVSINHHQGLLNPAWSRRCHQSLG